jgi:hypothetical protein
LRRHAYLGGMSKKLSDLSVEELRKLLRANEQAIGANATSTRIIRRELDRKLATIRGAMPCK